MNLENLKKIQNNLLRASQKVELLAVTKEMDLHTIQALIQEGIVAIGENRVEVAHEKFPYLPTKIEKHFIGQLQSKKIKRIVELFDVIQSVGSNEHLLKIDQLAKQFDKKIKVFLQFNISAEAQKAGYPLEDIEMVKNTLKKIKFIKVIGLMGMASDTEDQSRIRAQFKCLKVLRDELQKEYPSIKELSMGMSSDYQIALEEEATWIRIGSLLSK